MPGIVSWPLLSIQSLPVSLADEVPVNDLEERRHVLRPPVLIFQIVGVLPNIHPKQGLLVPADRRVLIGRRLDAQLLVRIEDHPGPAAPELAQSGLRQLLLENGKTAKPLLNPLQKFPEGWPPPSFFIICQKSVWL